ncbi:MAG: hypothetical protein CMD27_00505 [Flavobacteriales bacterium]|nr:hypothetical protein [Flavobacteriales bacterium]
MKKLLILLLIPFLSFSQELFNSQSIYDGVGELYDWGELRDANINFYDSNYDEFLIQSWLENTKLTLPASCDIDGVYFDSVAVRYKGNSTFYIPYTLGNPKKPYNIDFNDYDSNQDLMGYSKIKLANTLFDPTCRKEILGYSIYRNYLPSPQANFMNLYVNNELLGLYVNTEAINSNFLDKHFGESDGVFFKCENQDLFGVSGGSLTPNLDYRGMDSTLYVESYELKSESGFKDLMDMIYTLNNNIDSIENYLNVDRALWYLAVNSCILNADTYSLVNVRNYYLYQTENGQFQIIPWDVSESFIGALTFWWGDVENLYEASPYFGYDPYIEDRPLLYGLLQVDSYRKIYDAHIRTIMNDFINTTYFEDAVEELGNIAYNSAQDDPNPIFLDGFQSNVNENYWFWDQGEGNWNALSGILNTLEERKNFLNDHPLMNESNPDIEYVSQNIENPQNGDEVIISSKITNVNQVELMITTQTDHFNFKSYEMNDSGINGDLLAGDDVYSCVVPFSDSGTYVQYYIRAHNEDAISLSPEKAEYEFYYYTVTPEFVESALVINEIMASNDQTQADEYGEFNDWIEIYNIGSSDINLGDYYLSDDVNILDKYNFPSVTLGPNEYFIVWADDDEEDQGDNHATFKLSASGEAVYLSDSNFNLVDGLTFGEQQTDMGYARVPNGTGPFVIQSPTFSNNNDLLSSQLEYKDDRQLIKITDILGRDVNTDSKKVVWLYIYNDGSIDKKYIK